MLKRAPVNHLIVQFEMLVMGRVSMHSFHLNLNLNIWLIQLVVHWDAFNWAWQFAHSRIYEYLICFFFFVSIDMHFFYKFLEKITDKTKSKCLFYAGVDGDKTELNVRARPTRCTYTWHDVWYLCRYWFIL